MSKPAYIARLERALAEAMPADAAYVVIVQRDGESRPNMITTEDDKLAIGRSLRDMAAYFGGDN